MAGGRVLGNCGGWRVTRRGEGEKGRDWGLGIRGLDDGEGVGDSAEWGAGLDAGHAVADAGDGFAGDLDARGELLFAGLGSGHAIHDRVGIEDRLGDGTRGHPEWL